MILNENDITKVVIHFKMSALLTKKDHETLYKLIFARREENEFPTIRSCLDRLSLGTRLKTTFKDNESQDEVFIFWRYDKSLATIKI